MIPKKSRLPSNGFREHGYKTIRSHVFSLKVKRNELAVNRLGVVVGKSVDKRATQRNLWERQVKAQFLKAPNQSKDFIVVVFPSVREIKRADFIKELAQAFKTS